MEQLGPFRSAEEALVYAGDFKDMRLHDIDVIEDFSAVVEPAAEHLTGDDAYRAILHQAYAGPRSAQEYAERVLITLRLINAAKSGERNTLALLWERVQQTESWKALQTEMRWRRLWQTYFDYDITPSVIATDNAGSIHEMTLSDENEFLQDEEGVEATPIIIRRLLRIRGADTELPSVTSVKQYIRDIDSEVNIPKIAPTYENLVIAEVDDDMGLSTDEQTIALRRAHIIMQQGGVRQPNPFNDYSHVLTSLPYVITHDRLEHLYWLCRGIQPVTDKLLQR